MKKNVKKKNDEMRIVKSVFSFWNKEKQEYFLLFLRNEMSKRDCEMLNGTYYCDFGKNLTE